jgi:hypothetical protein
MWVEIPVLSIEDKEHLHFEPNNHRDTSLNSSRELNLKEKNQLSGQRS